MGNEASEEEVRNEKEEILRIKAKVQEYGRDKIQQIQFEEAINQGLEVHQWDDIGKLFQQDGSEEMCEKIFQCMYGWFKKQDAYARATKQFNQLWARLIEAKFMEDYGLRYQSEEIVHTGKKRKPNGIESLISREYNELNKLINNRTKVTHRKKINIRHIKFNMRPTPVMFYPHFVTLWTEEACNKGKSSKSRKEMAEEREVVVTEKKIKENELMEKQTMLSRIHNQRLRDVGLAMNRIVGTKNLSSMVTRV